MRLEQNQLCLIVIVRKERVKRILIQYNIESGTREVWIPSHSIEHQVIFGVVVRFMVLKQVKWDGIVFDPIIEFSGNAEPIHQTEGEKRLIKIFQEHGLEALIEARFLNEIVPNEVDDQGFFHIIGLGPVNHVLGQRLEPPDGLGGEKVEVVAMFHSLDENEVCPSCGCAIQLGRCVFITEGDFLVYPCNVCNEWVWWWHTENVLMHLT